MVSLVKKVDRSLSCRRGSDSHILMSTSELPYGYGSQEEKILRMTSQKITQLLRKPAKKKLTKNETQDIIERVELCRVISETDFQNLEDIRYVSI